MPDRIKLAEALNTLLDECAIPPADQRLGLRSQPTVDTTRKDTPITANFLTDRRFPEKLEQFLAFHIAHPEYSAETSLVISSAMQSFGLRLFRRLLHVGLNRHECETDQAQNLQDVGLAVHVLQGLAGECNTTPWMPRETAELLGRVANALHDIWWNASRPALFDLPSPEGTISNTAAAFCEGHLAAAIEILILAGIKLAEAKKWMHSEIRAAGLLDEVGNPIGAARIASWRNNFNKGVGAGYARTFFRIELDHCRALVSRGPNESKQARYKDRARELVQMLAIRFNRTVPPPLKR
jgi:hypothetical protein